MEIQMQTEKSMEKSKKSNRILTRAIWGNKFSSDVLKTSTGNTMKRNAMVYLLLRQHAFGASIFIYESDHSLDRKHTTKANYFPFNRLRMSCRQEYLG